MDDLLRVSRWITKHLDLFSLFENISPHSLMLLILYIYIPYFDKNLFPFFNFFFGGKWKLSFIDSVYMLVFYAWNSAFYPIRCSRSF